MRASAGLSHTEFDFYTKYVILQFWYKFGYFTFVIICLDTMYGWVYQNCDGQRGEIAMKTAPASASAALPSTRSPLTKKRSSFPARAARTVKAEVKPYPVLDRSRDAPSALPSALPKCLTIEAVLKRIELARRTGETQDEFARRIGISQPMLSQVMRGKRPPGKELLKWMRLRQVDHYYEVVADGG